MPNLGAQSPTQFGAKQAIIVRDTADKTRLIGATGKFALILTVMESKGMEFEDVLLYDFFSTSECTSVFRALADSKTLDERHIVSAKGASKGMTMLIYLWGKGIMFGAEGSY